MHGVREHVHRLHLVQHEALLDQPGEIPGQGLGVAGDIDQPARRHGDQGLQHRLVTALAGRIHHHHIGSHALGVQLGHQLLGLAHVEFGVLYAVESCVATGIADGALHRLDAHHLGGLASQEQGDGADAAIDVEHRLVAGQLAVFQRLGVEHIGLARVVLEERERRDLERELVDLVADHSFPQQHAVARPQDAVGALVIDVLHQGSDGQIPQGRQQFGLEGQLLAQGHQHHHQLAALEALAGHQVAHAAGVGHFVIGGNVVLTHPAAHPGIELHMQGVLHRAVVGGDEIMGVLAIEADLGPRLAATHRVLRLVAVSEGTVHAEDGVDLGLTQPNLLQRALHQRLFQLELGRIGQRAHLTAAALGVGAEIGNPVGGRLGQLDQLAVQIVRLDLGQLDQRLLTGQQTLDKQGAIEQATLAIPLVGQFQNIDLMLVSH